jgi:hypothetical protein
LRKPYTNGGTITETITIDTTTVTSAYFGTGGSLFNIQYQYISTEMAPSSSQISVTDSSFTGIYSDGNGAFATLNVDTIQMDISGTTFSKCYAGYNGLSTSSAAYGGVIYA